MLVYIEIVHIYFFLQIEHSLSRQGEASKDKIDAGKIPPSVSLRAVRLGAVSDFAESDSAQR